mmetsp:Transcript_1459/g.2216  ORF Transcript_1459/g.2216 Transcript_1459/m.2216 type:complete len:188 (+) Transcript_1459:337-900(+)
MKEGYVRSTNITKKKQHGGHKRSMELKKKKYREGLMRRRNLNGSLTTHHHTQIVQSGQMIQQERREQKKSKMDDIIEEYEEKQQHQTLENGGGEASNTINLNELSSPNSPSERKISSKTNYKENKEESINIFGSSSKKMSPPHRRSQGAIPKDHCIYFACQYKNSLARQIHSFKSYSLINYRRFIPI